MNTSGAKQQSLIIEKLWLAFALNIEPLSYVVPSNAICSAELIPIRLWRTNQIPLRQLIQLQNKQYQKQYHSERWNKREGNIEKHEKGWVWTVHDTKYMNKLFIPETRPQHIDGSSKKGGGLGKHLSIK